MSAGVELQDIRLESEAEPDNEVSANLSLSTPPAKPVYGGYRVSRPRATNWQEVKKAKRRSVREGRKED